VDKVDETLAAPGPLSAVAVEMVSIRPLSDYFSAAPPQSSLHIIAQAPNCKSPAGNIHPLNHTDTVLYAIISASERRGCLAGDGSEPVSRLRAGSYHPFMA
jgi:hypothetical protein